MSTDCPAIHILIPAYNAASFIERSVRSVLNQTHPATKIVIYDDGSTDETASLVHQLSTHVEDGKITLLRGAENRRIAHARQTLVDASKQIDPQAAFMWLDADDYLTSAQSVQIIMDQLQRTGADLCLINFNLEWENEDPALKANAAGLLMDKKNHEGLLADIAARPEQIVSFATCPNLLTATSLGCTKIYSGSFKAEWPRFDTAYLFEDFPPMALLLRANKITALSPDTPVITFLRRASSTTGDRMPRHFYEDIVVQLANFLKAVPTSDTERHKAATDFVRAKTEQYRQTLAALIAANRTGFDETVMVRYQEATRLLLAAE